ncbi:MAG TPA: ScyD/ScyE family protein [Fimbriiglobus sp.]|jgi:hypothetical protein|nr:ScyD/ScyE family protein [Fimbriiglobus sp.]
MLLNSLLKFVTPCRDRNRTRSLATSRLAVEPLEDRAVPADLTVVMSGLDNPRGLAFGPEGALYVAEAGRGGDGPSFEIRPGVIAKYGPTGAVSRLWHDEQARVATGLPSYIAPDGATGPHDISFQGRGNAYVTVGFGGNPTRRSELGEVGAGFAQLVRLTPNGNWQNVFDIGTNEATANPGGGPLDSNPYGLLAEAGGQVLTDAGGNVLLRIAANGTVSTLAEFPSRDDGHLTDAVPTCVTRGPDGAYYVGQLTGVPFAAGTANIFRVVPGEAPEVVYTGFKTIIDIDFGPDGSLYVLQHATGPFLSGNGALIRVAPDGTRTTIASEGLVRPTSVLVGNDGAVYVSNRGISVGTGEVLRITPTLDEAGAGGSIAPLSKIALPPTPIDVVRADSLPRFKATKPDWSDGVEVSGDRAVAPMGSQLLHQNPPEVGLGDSPGAWPGEDDLYDPIVV